MSLFAQLAPVKGLLADLSDPHLTASDEDVIRTVKPLVDDIERLHTALLELAQEMSERVDGLDDEDAADELDYWYDRLNMLIKGE